MSNGDKLLTAAIVIILLLLGWFVMTVSIKTQKAQAECEAKGGHYIKTRSGDHCVAKLESKDE